MKKQKLKRINRRLTDEERARHAKIIAAVLREIPPKGRVKLLGKSKKFMRFLKERSKEAGTTTLEEYRRSLD